MRGLATGSGIRSLFAALGREATRPARAYLTGGATAVLLGWRESTIDVDLKLEGADTDALLRAIPHLKEELQLNVELSAPSDFMPVPDGWEARSRFEVQEGQLAVYHFDLLSQALAKLHRGHQQDVADVRAMLRLGFVDEARIREGFAAIEAELYRFPAIDPASYRAAIETFFA